MQDLRGRQVARWLTFGGITAGLAAAGLAGWPALVSSAIGLAAGGGLLLPVVLLGGVGPADALVLALIGAWQGGPFALRAAAWSAIVGGVIACLVLLRGQRSFPYIPAIATGTMIALLTK
jgi:Flp pilus assembly protein protease CpaA